MGSNPTLSAICLSKNSKNGMGVTMINIVLADDHELVRAGIRNLLAAQPGMKVVGEASSGEDALAVVRETQPDVVLMDLRMPGIGGIGATEKLVRSHPEVKVIVLTVVDQNSIPNRLFKAGAKGYLTKGCPPEELVKAIAMVDSGKNYISSELAQRLAMLDSLGGNDDKRLEDLSPREFQVMIMVTQGKEIQEISDTLNLSPKTVSTYRYRVFDKLGVKNDVELTRYAISHGVFGDELSNV